MPQMATASRLPALGGAGSGGTGMLHGWLLPDASYRTLSEVWRRAPYLPRHGRPPLLARVTRTAARVAGPVRERYLGTGGTDNVPGTARPVA